MKKGLGSGLNALFGNLEDGEAKGADIVVTDIESAHPFDNFGRLKDGVAMIDIRQICPNPDQPRKHFDEIALRELSASIKIHGILQPIVVTKVPEHIKLVIVAGERRYRAAQMAGLEKIPALIKNTSAKDRQEFALIENMQREDLNPIEEAQGISELAKTFNLTQEEIAARLGKSRPAVTNALRLLTLQPQVIDMILTGKLTAGHGRALAALASGEKNIAAQLAYAEAACDKKMSVRELELMVNAYMNPAKRGEFKPRPPITPELKELVSDMQRIFATKVKAVGTEDKGRIYIDYYTKDDLNRIFDLMDTLKQ